MPRTVKNIRTRKAIICFFIIIWKTYLRSDSGSLYYSWTRYPEKPHSKKPELMWQTELSKENSWKQGGQKEEFLKFWNCRSTMCHSSFWKCEGSNVKKKKNICITHYFADILNGDQIFRLRIPLSYKETFDKHFQKNKIKIKNNKKWKSFQVVEICFLLRWRKWKSGKYKYFYGLVSALINTPLTAPVTNL